MSGVSIIKVAPHDSHTPPENQQYEMTWNKSSCLQMHHYAIEGKIKFELLDNSKSVREVNVLFRIYPKQPGR